MEQCTLFKRSPTFLVLINAMFSARFARFSYLCFLLFTSQIISAQTTLDQVLDFVTQEQTIPESLWQLSEQSGIQITFSDNDFSSRRYSFNFKQQPFQKILERLLAGDQLIYKITGSQILLVKKPKIRFTLSGYVEDKATGERLIGANIYDMYSGKGAISNEYGFFSLTLKSSPAQIRASYLGYQTKSIKISEVTNQQLLLDLSPSLTLEEVVIIAKDDDTAPCLSISDSSFPLEQSIEKLPSLGGEVDILRVMQQLPGVQTGPDGFGGLHVRGGNADQNLVLLDGVPIYNPNHTLGLYSIFDHQSIQKVQYLRGHFPARFGGRVSSVVDVRTRDGNNKTFHAKASLGLIASKLSIEGPIVKNKGAFYISARRSHIDPFLKKYSKKIREAADEVGYYNYYFGEILGKLNYTFSSKDRLYLSFYRGTDNYKNEQSFSDFFQGQFTSFAENQALNWGNTLGVIRWNHQLGQQLFSNLTLNYSQFIFNTRESVDDRRLQDNVEYFRYAFQNAYRSKIETISAKLDLDYIPSPKHYIRAGFSFAHNQFRPGVASVRDSLLTDYSLPFIDSLLNPISIKVFEWNAYLEDQWRIRPGLNLNLGVFTSLFSVRDKQYFIADPRVSLYWDIIKALRLQISANSMSQYLHLLSRSGSGFPNDLWVPSTDRVDPQRSRMIDLGLVWNFQKNWSFSANAYYKKMRNLINYAEGANFSVNSEAINSTNWEDKITTGRGDSKGLEFLLKKEQGKGNGWISYTLSKTNRQFSALNQGKAFPFRFDLRHVLNIVLAYDLSPNWSISSTWNYSTGSRISLALNQWQYIREDGTPDYIYLDFGTQNDFELPAYHRMDFAVKYHTAPSWGKWSFDIGVYNVYNRRNIFYIKPDYDPITLTGTYKSVSLIPILPYFSLNIAL